MTPKEARLKDSFNAQSFSNVNRVKLVTGYYVDADIPGADLIRAAEQLFEDPVVEQYSVNELPWEDYAFCITVGYKPGVTDNVGHTASIAVKDLGIAADAATDDFIHAFRVYAVWTDDESTIPGLEKALFNPIVEFAFVSQTGVELPDYNLSKIIDPADLVKDIPIIDASDEELLDISKIGLLALNLDEMKAIQDHYRQACREPTDVELETFAQTWSEHCVHKTLKGDFQFVKVSESGERTEELIHNLVKSTIFDATMKIQEIQGKNDICVSIFKDNAGIIKFNDDYNVCFKCETHNHPSAKEPYGGAATGIGGVIRDILAAGLGARPIADTDIFCFAEPDFPEDKVPEGVIHPKKIMRGVVSGVRDYGNPMGIPTVNGSLYFDQRYLGNPLVFCGTAGLIPRFIQGQPSEEKAPGIGDYLVFVGGKTGRDGIHGVTFASLEMDKFTTSNPVQIGDPITEQMFMEAQLKARDKRLYTFVQDCGGGGLSSAFGEMVEGLGGVIQLDQVPLKYQGLLPWEIWISESQERQAFSVPPENLEEFKEVFESENVGVYKIGEITGDKRLVLKYGDTVVADIDVNFLHEGIPRAFNLATWTEPALVQDEFDAPESLGQVLHALLASWNVCSKEWVVRQYDSEVQGNTILKPLQGVMNDGPGDAAVLKPDARSYEGLVISNGMNPKYGDIDPYWMAAAGIDEAIRNAVCSGVNPGHLALLDNFCWGNPRNADQMGRLVLACQACKDIAVGFGTPFISGKDSLNNEYITDEGAISIPPTLLISALGKMEDVRHAKTSYFKQPGNAIFITGETANELGGSHYLEAIGKQGSNTVIPRVYPDRFKEQYAKIHEAMVQDLVLSAHDCSEGGIGVAVAEMCLAGDIGAAIDLSAIPATASCSRDDFILFSESQGRIILEVPEEKVGAFEAWMERIACRRIGTVQAEKRLQVQGLQGEQVLDEDVSRLKLSWIKPLDLEDNLIKEY
jgi:phosphoribosylformylglycinamidine synthase